VKRIVFCHIPKTGGTTLNGLLRGYFGPRILSVIPAKGTVYTYDDLKRDLKYFKNVQCFSGHSMRPYIDFKEHEFRWFTFLREPYERYISHYIHQKTNRNKNYNMDLIRWGQTYKRSNWQVRWIAGEESFDKAIELLETKFSFVGITEELITSLLYFQSDLELPNFYKPQSPKNLSRRPNLKKYLLAKDSGYLEFIAQQNSLDKKLYQYFVQKNSLKQRPRITEYLVDNYPRRFLNNLAFKLHHHCVYRPLIKLNSYKKNTISIV